MCQLIKIELSVDQIYLSYNTDLEMVPGKVNPFQLLSKQQEVQLHSTA